jgi:uncharacterized protein
MADDLRPVPIQELKGLAEGRRWRLDQHLDELASLTPVRGEVQVQHLGNALAVEGHGATIVTLRCDRCLQQFNHPLNFRSQELLWLGEAARQEGMQERIVLEDASEVLDLDPDALSESLDPNGCFDPAHWTYELLSLQLPTVNRCGSDCPGPATWSSDDQGGDPRWAKLNQLR